MSPLCQVIQLSTLCQSYSIRTAVHTQNPQTQSQIAFISSSQIRIKELKVASNQAQTTNTISCGETLSGYREAAQEIEHVYHATLYLLQIFEDSVTRTDSV